MPYKQKLQGVSVTSTTATLTLSPVLTPPAVIKPLPQAPVLTP